MSPEKLFTRELTPEKFLSEIVIRPHDLRLKKRELLKLNTILAQTLSFADSEGEKEVFISVNTDLFRALEISLSSEPQWRSSIAVQGGRVKLSSVIELIETTQRK